MKRRAAACLAALVLPLCFAGAGLAHRVNVFAFADGGAIRVECSFSKSHKVKNGKLVISDLETGAMLLEGTTDEQGLFRFRPDARWLQSGHGLNILLNAGEGHQNTWRVAPEELAALSPAERFPQIPHGGARETASPAPSPIPPSDAATREAAIEALVGRVMDEKLAPIKQALARRETDGPDLRDVVGGIGWIIGLLGLAAYMKCRR